MKTNKVVLITGGAQGIGKGMAVLFLEQQMNVIIVDSDQAGFITGANFIVDGGMTHKMIYVES